MIALKPWVVPFQGFRKIDAFGGGGYMAPRDGGSRPHLGQDLIARVGDAVVSPLLVNATISHIGIAYPDSLLGSIHLVPKDDPSHKIKLLYVHCTCALGDIVRPGDIIGIAQNVAAYHEGHHPEIVKVGGHMINHVHGEVYENGNHIDPSACLAILGAA